MSPRGRITRQREVSVIMISLLLFTSFNIYAGPGSGDDGGPTSRAGITGCPESMPPPIIGDAHYGDWTITCEVTVSKTTLLIAGNIIIKLGGSLLLKESALVEQVTNASGPFQFEVFSQGGLTIEESSLRADNMKVWGQGDLFVRKGSLRVRGQLDVDSGLFELTDSALTVLPDAYGISPDANLNIKAQAVFLKGSTLSVQGANAPAGNETTAPKDGGDAHSTLYGHVVSNLTITVRGGNGGRANNQTFGDGHQGGDGGDADLEFITEEGQGVEIMVIGGYGGSGGNGADSLVEMKGGQGNDGGDGGQGRLTLVSTSRNMGTPNLSDPVDFEEVDVYVKGGNGGYGGDGGTSKGREGGNAGDGGDGGTGTLELQGQVAKLLDGTFICRGGSGGNGGHYGKDLDGASSGQPGNGGTGGGAVTELEVYGNLTLVSSEMEVKGGKGGDGETGWQYGGDGGPAGNSTLAMHIGENLTVLPTVDIRGKTGPRPQLEVIGGNGGMGGPYEKGQIEEYMGRVGRSGSGTMDADCHGIASFKMTDFLVDAGAVAKGRPPLSGGKEGRKDLFLTAARYTVEDSTSDTAFEGLKGQGVGLLRNTVVTGEPQAVVWEWETSAMVEVYWHLKVNFSPMLDDQTAQVTVMDNDQSDGPVAHICTLRGGWDICDILAKGEVITSKGHRIINYTVQAESDDGVVSSPMSFYLTGNKEIMLTPEGNFYAPHINITYPEDGMTFTVEDLATGIVKIYGMTWEDMRDPPTWVDHIEVELTNWYTRDVVVIDAEEAFNITPMSSSLSKWEYRWDLKEKVGYMPRWASGPYRLCVKAFDGEVWSNDNDTRREGRKVCVNLAVFQEEGKKPVTPIPLDRFPKQLTGEIPADGDYVEVLFNTTTIRTLGETGDYYKFEWDFDLDGKMDWYYLPTNGTSPPRAAKVYTVTGIYTARLYFTDINGDISIVDVQVNIKKAVEEEPVATGVPNYCLPALLSTLIILGLFYISALYIEAWKFMLLMKIFVPLHRRYRKRLLKEDSIRRQISDYLLSKPGRFFTKVKLDLEMRSLILARELTFLEEEGLATHKRDGTQVRLISLREKKKEKRALRPYQRKILKMLISEPWQPVSKVASSIGRSETFIRRQLDRMMRKGLVVSRSDPEEGELYRAKIPTKKRTSYKRKKRPEEDLPPSITLPDIGPSGPEPVTERGPEPEPPTKEEQEEVVKVKVVKTRKKVVRRPSKVKRQRKTVR